MGETVEWNQSKVINPGHGSPRVQTMNTSQVELGGSKQQEFDEN